MKLPILMTVIAGRPGIALPYTYNPSTQPDGSLPVELSSPGTGWAVSSGVVVNTPAGTSKMTNGNFEGAFSSGLAASFGKSVSPTVAESADAHGGSKAQAFTAGAKSDFIYQPNLAVTVNAFVNAVVWGKRLTTTGAGTARGVFQNGMGDFTHTDYTKHVITVMANSTPKTFSVIREEGTTNLDSYVIDDAEVVELVTTNVFCTALTKTPNIKVAVVTTRDGLSMSGAVARLNSRAAPTDYLIAYVGGSGVGVYLDKVVAGVPTNLTSGTPTITAGGKIEIWVQGTSAALYYNDVKIGSTVTVPASSATLHGYFDAYGGNSLGSLTLTAYPF